MRRSGISRKLNIVRRISSGSSVKVRIVESMISPVVLCWVGRHGVMSSSDAEVKGSFAASRMRQLCSASTNPYFAPLLSFSLSVMHHVHCLPNAGELSLLSSIPNCARLEAYHQTHDKRAKRTKMIPNAKVGAENDRLRVTLVA